jgi:hypothetical protein
MPPCMHLHFRVYARTCAFPHRASVLVGPAATQEQAGAGAAVAAASARRRGRLAEMLLREGRAVEAEAALRLNMEYFEASGVGDGVWGLCG